MRGPALSNRSCGRVAPARVPVGHARLVERLEHRCQRLAPAGQLIGDAIGQRVHLRLCAWITEKTRAQDARLAERHRSSCVLRPALWWRLACDLVIMMAENSVPIILNFNYTECLGKFHHLPLIIHNSSLVSQPFLMVTCNTRILKSVSDSIKLNA